MTDSLQMQSILDESHLTLQRLLMSSEASSTAVTMLNTAQAHLDKMEINDDSKEPYKCNRRNKCR